MDTSTHGIYEIHVYISISWTALAWLASVWYERTDGQTLSKQMSRLDALRGQNVSIIIIICTLLHVGFQLLRNLPQDLHRGSAPGSRLQTSSHSPKPPFICPIYHLHCWISKGAIGTRNLRAQGRVGSSWYPSLLLAVCTWLFYDERNLRKWSYLWIMTTKAEWSSK